MDRRLATIGLGLAALFSGACINPAIFFPTPPMQFSVNAGPVPSDCPSMPGQAPRANSAPFDCGRGATKFLLTRCDSTHECRTAASYPTMTACLDAVSADALAAATREGGTLYCSRGN